MQTVIRSTSASGQMTIEVIDGQGVIAPVDRPLVPRLGSAHLIALNDDATIVAYVEGDIQHDLTILVLKGDRWERVFCRRMGQVLVTAMTWLVVAPPELLIQTDSSLQYLVYEWRDSWSLKPQ